MSRIKSNAWLPSDLRAAPSGYYFPAHLDFERFSNVLENADFWYASLWAKDPDACHKGSCITIRKEIRYVHEKTTRQRRNRSSLRAKGSYAVWWASSTDGPMVSGYGGKLHVEPFLTCQEALDRAEREAIRAETKWIVTRTDRENPTLLRR